MCKARFTKSIELIKLDPDYSALKNAEKPD